MRPAACDRVPCYEPSPGPRLAAPQPRVGELQLEPPPETIRQANRSTRMPSRGPLEF
jgi:hypothetical protein